MQVTVLSTTSTRYTRTARTGKLSVARVSGASEHAVYVSVSMSGPMSGPWYPVLAAWESVGSKVQGWVD
jgi:hypothetical protein